MNEQLRWRAVLNMLHPAFLKDCGWTDAEIVWWQNVTPEGMRETINAATAHWLRRGRIERDAADVEFEEICEDSAKGQIALDFD